MNTRRFQSRATTAEVGLSAGEVVATKRARLGTALHQLAIELARERRRNAALERENRRLRDLLDSRGDS